MPGGGDRDHHRLASLQRLAPWWAVAVLLVIGALLSAALTINQIATNKLLRQVGQITHSVCVLKAHSLRQKQSEEIPAQQGRSIVRRFVVTGTCVGTRVMPPPGGP